METILICFSAQFNSKELVAIKKAPSKTLGAFFILLGM